MGARAGDDVHVLMSVQNTRVVLGLPTQLTLTVSNVGSRFGSFGTQTVVVNTFLPDAATIPGELLAGCTFSRPRLTCERHLDSGQTEQLHIPIVFGAVGLNRIVSDVRARDGSGELLGDDNFTNNTYELKVFATEDSDGDGLPVDFELKYELDVENDDAAADSDQDGVSNRSEYEARTNPLDRSSRPSRSGTSRLRNISTRAPVGTGDKVLIGGLIIQGQMPKSVIVRARGPSLASAGVPGALTDPQLALYDASGTLLDVVDSWHVHRNAGHVLAARLAPDEPGGAAIPQPLEASASVEAALQTILLPGAYTEILSGVGGEEGVGIVEIFEVDDTGNTRLTNISTRGYVGTGDEVLIGGVIVTGELPRTLTFRGRGPSLHGLIGDAPELQDPRLEIFNQANGRLIGGNDDMSAEDLSIPDYLRPFAKEAAVTMNLLPGAYTAIMKGAGESEGVGIVEAFEVDSKYGEGLSPNGLENNPIHIGKTLVVDRAGAIFDEIELTSIHQRTWSSGELGCPGGIGAIPTDAIENGNQVILTYNGTAHDVRVTEAGHTVLCLE